MANNNNDLVFYQQWAAAGQQIDKYSMQPWCVDSENLDIFSDSQAIKWMPWSVKSIPSWDSWVDVDSKERFYLAADGRVYDSKEDVWYNHDYFDENANNIDYQDWQWSNKAVFWTPKKLYVAYSWDDWKTISILTDRLIYNIYSDWIHISAWSVYWLRTWEACTRDWEATWRTTRMSVKNTGTTRYNWAQFDNSWDQNDDCPWGFHTESDRTENFMRAKVKIVASWAAYKDITLEARKSVVSRSNQYQQFISEWTWDKVLDLSVASISSWWNYTTPEFFFDNFINQRDYWWWQSWIYVHATTDRNANCQLYAYFYQKEDWSYLYPKDRKTIDIEDETYIEVDSTEYEMLYYDPLTDEDNVPYYELIQWNTIDFPDGYNIVAFARSFDYQYVFVNKWDMWIVYLTTDANLAAWDSWWRFPWTQFVNAIMIWTYAYVIAEKRWVRWLYVFYNWDMKLLVWANNKYTEELDLINWKEIFNFTGIMANWRDKVVCATKDSVFMWWATKLGNNAGAFILKVDWEITDINTKRWYLDVYFTKNQQNYRQSIQDDVNIKNYESEFSVTYPVQISSHLVEKEPLSLALSYNLPNDNTKLEAYISVNDNYFWSFLTDWEVTPEEWAKYKVSWLSWNYWLNFVEKKWNWLTFYLSGDLPYQTSNTKNLVSEDTEQTIAFTDFNHFKYLWEVKKENPEEIDWKHTYLNLTTKNDLPIVRKAQVKIIWITDNHTTPEIYWIRLLSNQFDK